MKRILILLSTITLLTSCAKKEVVIEPKVVDVIATKLDAEKKADWQRKFDESNASTAYTYVANLGGPSKGLMLTLKGQAFETGILEKPTKFEINQYDLKKDAVSTPCPDGMHTTEVNVEFEKRGGLEYQAKLPELFFPENKVLEFRMCPKVAKSGAAPYTIEVTPEKGDVCLVTQNITASAAPKAVQVDADSGVIESSE